MRDFEEQLTKGRKEVGVGGNEGSYEGERLLKEGYSDFDFT